jgi:hypothetical protein
MAKAGKGLEEARIPVVDLHVKVPQAVLDDVDHVHQSGLAGVDREHVVNQAIVIGIDELMKRTRSIMENRDAIRRLGQKRKR